MQKNDFPGEDLKAVLFLCTYLADVMFPHHTHQMYMDT